MSAILLVSLILFAIGAVMVAVERPGLSRAGFILEACAAVIAAVVAMSGRL